MKSTARLRDQLATAAVALCFFAWAGSVGCAARAQDSPAGQDTPAALPAIYHGVEQRPITVVAKRTFAQMQGGTLDYAAFSATARKALDGQQLALAAQQLQALGEPAWSYLGEYHPPSGPAPQIYLLKFASVALRLEIGLDRDGRITNFFLSPAPD